MLLSFSQSLKIPSTIRVTWSCTSCRLPRPGPSNLEERVILRIIVQESRGNVGVDGLKDNDGKTTGGLMQAEESSGFQVSTTYCRYASIHSVGSRKLLWPAAGFSWRCRVKSQPWSMLAPSTSRPICSNSTTQTQRPRLTALLDCTTPAKLTRRTTLVSKKPQHPMSAILPIVFREGPMAEPYLKMHSVQLEGENGWMGVENGHSLSTGDEFHIDTGLGQ